METTNKKEEEAPQMGKAKPQSDWDAKINSLVELQSDFRDSTEKLGVVLEELVKMLDLDGSGIDVFLLQYVVDARQSLRAINEIMDDSPMEKTVERMHKSNMVCKNLTLSRLVTS